MTARSQHSNTGLIIFQQLLTLKKKRKIRLDSLGYGYSSGLLPAATKLGQGNVFTGVCLSTGGRVSASVHAGMPDPPPRPGTPPRADTPPGPGTPPRSRLPPGTRHTPPPGADSSIRSTSGRYASYWNALLFAIYFINVYWWRSA